MLFAAGLQCSKRLYLDHQEGGTETLSESRRALSLTGTKLIELARTAFPKGQVVDATDDDAAAAATRKLLADDSTFVVFGGTFQSELATVRTDILLRQKDGRLDLYEVKSGTKVKPRYLQDLAMQVSVIESCGYQVRAAHVLHVNARYLHDTDAGYAVQKLFRNADATARVRRLVPRIPEQLATFRAQLADASTLDLPMGTWCTNPFPCPHLARCAAGGPAFPLRELPDLTRNLEAKLHEEAVEDLSLLDPKRPGLTFRQRRTIQSVQQNVTIVEPFVRDELRSVEWPLHFLAIGALVEVLPQFTGQRPWRQLPYAWSVHTLHQDGRAESASFGHADKDDPRPGFVRSLAARLQGGMLVSYGDENLAGLRNLLEELPAEKSLVRSILGMQRLDARKLLDTGYFHPQLHGNRELPAIAAAVLGERMPPLPAIQDADQARALIEKATAPRVRAATREKAVEELRAWVDWQSRTTLAIHQALAGSETIIKVVDAGKPVAPRPAKQLPSSNGEPTVVPAPAADARPARKKSAAPRARRTSPGPSD